MTEFQEAGDEFSEIVELEGHLIDSYILPKVFDRIMDLGGEFEVLEFRIGRRKHETSYAKLLVKGKNQNHLNLILKELRTLGAIPVEAEEVRVEEAPADMVLPDGFYSTTHHPTWVRFNGRWIRVEDICMDKVIVVDPKANRAYCKGIRDVKKGDLIVVGERGVRVRLPDQGEWWEDRGGGGSRSNPHRSRRTLGQDN